MPSARRLLKLPAFIAGVLTFVALCLPAVVLAAIPETTITSGPAGLTNQATATFAFSADQPDSSFECRIDSETFATCNGEGSHTVGPLLDGTHTFEVRGSTVDGPDPTPASREFVVDTTPPETSISSGPSEGETVGRRPRFAFSSNEADSTFACQLDFGVWLACFSPQLLGPLADGSHTFSVVAADAATNQDPSAALRSFQVDALPPDTRITQHPPKQTNDQTPTFVFSANEPVRRFQCRIDGGGWRTCSSPISYRLDPRQHVFGVRAVDQYGNREEVPGYWGFRILPPPREPLPGPPQSRFKRLRISNVRDTNTGSGSGAYTSLTATAPRKWTIRNPGRCAAFGYQSGVQRKGWGYGPSGRRIHARFAGDITVDRPIVVRCPRLRHKFTTIDRVQRWDRRSKERRGTETSDREARGSCRFSHLYGGLTPDCHGGGGYAIAKYHFGLPRDARRVRHSADGEEQCCDFGGKISKRWITTQNGNLAYVVKVTGFRAWTVRRVHVRYETKISHRVRRHHTTFAKGYGKLR